MSETEKILSTKRRSSVVLICSCILILSATRTIPFTGAFYNSFHRSSSTSTYGYSRNQHRRHNVFSPLRYQNENSTTETPASVDVKESMSTLVDPTISPFGEHEYLGPILQIHNEDHLKFFMDNHPKSLVILKLHAPYCKACKKLGPLYRNLATDEKLKPYVSSLIFAEMSVGPKVNLAYVKRLGIRAIPTATFFAGSDGLIHSMTCSPSKIKLLRIKLSEILTERFNDSLELILQETVPCRSRPIDKTSEFSLTQSEQDELRATVPYFQDMSVAEFKDMQEKMTLCTYEPGSVILRQGMPGRSFYVIQSGEVEVKIRGGYEDILTTPTDYLGFTVNTLTSGNYFGERALISGENLAATLYASKKTRCFYIREEHIPSSSFLGLGRQTKAARILEADEKYGVDLGELTVLEMQNQFSGATFASQNRGSANHPLDVRGIDTDEDEDDALTALDDADVLV